MSHPSAELALLSTLLDELLDLPEAERPAWLSRLPPSQAHWRTRLLEALAELQEAPEGAKDASLRTPFQHLLEGLPSVAGRAAAERLSRGEAPEAIDPLDTEGRCIGPYRLLSPLGEGGMGTVWLAERVDGSLRRKVALKLPHLNRLDPVFLHRFERERDILAALEHPLIARLYDAGVTPEGQPYLALEVVEGVPLTTHCKQAGLDLRARIALFRQVLQAVQFAHSRLVIHRDLKPSNILVTPEGQVRLLDFGIATLMDDGQSPADDVLTQWASTPLTPDYASPEQIAGLDLGTASDVYSLGVILYELLTEKRPFQRNEALRAALQGAKEETAPAKPSKALAATRTPATDAADGPGATKASALSARPALPWQARELRGDLDNITLKALRHQAEARYRSAEALEQDLLRWLNHEPVEAQPGNRLYVAAKFIARHRLPVGAAALASLALITGTAVAVVQARVAERESQHAKAVQGMLVSLFEEADPAHAQGHELTVRDLLRSGERKLQSQLDTEPDLAAALSAVLVKVEGKLGDAKHGLPVAEAWAASALAHHGAASPEYTEALIALADMQSALGQHERALQTVALARPAVEARLGRRPDDEFALRTISANSLLALTRYDEALAALTALRQAQLQRFGARSFPAASTLAKIAATLASQGRKAEAVQALRELEPALEQRWPEEGMGSAALRANVGYVEWQVRRWPEAERSLQAGIAEIDRLVGPDNTQSIEAGRTLGMVYIDAGRYAQASQRFGQNLERSRRFFGPGDSETALNLSFHVMALARTGAIEQAEDEARESLRLAGGKTTLSASEVRGVKRRLAYVLAWAGKAEEALRLTEALRSEEEASGPTDTRHGVTLSIQAAALTALGRPREAAKVAAAASAVWRQTGTVFGPVGQIGLAKALLTEVIVWLAAGEPARAQPALDEAQALLRSAHPQPHADLAQADLLRARWMQASGSAAAGKLLEAEARERFEKLSGSPAPKTLSLPL